MCPERANVCIINDSPGTIRATRFLLEISGHRVVATATTLEEAHAVIPTLENLGVQVVLVDGNLSPNDTSGQDGALIAQEIRRRALTVTTIGVSASGHVVGVDINFDPRKSDPQNLVDLITKI